MGNPKSLHPSIRKQFGVGPDTPDKEILSYFRARAKDVCKPCWELKYCPYGRLVEDSPLLPVTLDEALEHQEYLKNCVTTGMVGEPIPLTDAKRKIYEKCVANFDPKNYKSDPTGQLTAMQMAGHNKKGVELTREAAVSVNEDMKRNLKTGMDGHYKKISAKQKKDFKQRLSDFDPNNYPPSIPKLLLDLQCTVFGHLCPVFLNAEKMTETEELRRSGRYISFKTKMRVVRRDNYTCQHCGKHLLDNEVEFDHVIPHAKGGSSEEHNIRLTCFECNRSKSDNVTV